MVAAHCVGVPFPSDMQGIYRFHDSSSVEVQLSECFSHPTTFSSFEEFLLNSTREFVLLQFSIGNKPGSIEDCTLGLDKLCFFFSPIILFPYSQDLCLLCF